MKIFLTGASGFLGSHTAEELVKRGHRVSALVRKTSHIDQLRPFDLNFIEGALPETHSLTPYLEEADAVIHIAGIVKALSEKEFQRVNTEGTSVLVDQVLAAKNKPKIFLYVSTLAVQNPVQDGEDFCLDSEKCHPLTYYGKSKLGGELAIKKLSGKVRWIILRPPVLYGPRDQELLPLFKALRYRIAPLFGRGNNRLSLCYITEVARAICDLVQSPPPSDKIFCLDDGEVHTWTSLIQTLSRLMDRNAFKLTIPPFLFYTAAALSQSWAKLSGKSVIFTLNKMLEMKQKSWVCGYQKLNETLGWKPEISVKEGFKRTLDFYQSEGILKFSTKQEA